MFETQQYPLVATLPNLTPLSKPNEKSSMKNKRHFKVNHVYDGLCMSV